MCADCWQAYGSPAAVSPQIVTAVALIRRVYEGWEPPCDNPLQAYCVAHPDREGFPCEWFQGFSGHATGGNLHTQLDDWNLDDFRQPFHVYRSLAPHQLAVQRACYEHMQRLTEVERATALALYNGFLHAALE